MGATRPASGIKAKAHTPNKGSQTALITRLFVSLCLKNPDAGRVAIRGSVWRLRLEFAFGAGVRVRSHVYVSADSNNNELNP